MIQYVVLLRGINVGGHNKLPMADFRALLEGLGCEAVSTYIQSGNAVFRSSEKAATLMARIPAAIEAQFGFSPQTLVLTENRFRAIAAANPFAADIEDPKHLHVSFLSTAAKNANTVRMAELAADDEKYLLTDRAYYLHAPNGIGRSKLAAEVEKCLGVPATARNWRTVGKLLELLDA